MANVWRDAVPTSSIDSSPTSGCEKYFVPAGTLVFFDAVEQQSVTISVQSSGSYMPDCSGEHAIVDSRMLESAQEPFYGSVIPIAYTISATTLVAWLLFLLLLIAQKKRPWFQTFMTLFVATSLTVFLARTTSVLESQYGRGYHDAEELRHDIFGSLSFRILEVLSVLIIWLAHLQVILRMFNRAREKLIIKWAGLILAIIDCTFWCLVNFLVPFHTENHVLKDTIPVLAYLFQITIQVVYAGAVVIYSIRKRKYAYRRTSLVTAFISLGAILLPLIFFILDLAEYWITGWSEFIRWVSDAAASVVVWEWIDLIEKFEKVEQKTGVLGRQIYEENDLGIGKRKSSSGSTDEGDGGGDISKLYNRRNFLWGGHRWIISRASSSAGSGATTYGGGGEIRMSNLAPVSNHNAQTTPSISEPERPSPIYTHHQHHLHHQQAPGLSPTPEGVVAPTTPSTIANQPISNTAAANSAVASTAVAPSSGELVKHMHPLRRSSKRNVHNLAGTNNTPEPSSSSSPLHSSPKRPESLSPRHTPTALPENTLPSTTQRSNTSINTHTHHFTTQPGPDSNRHQPVYLEEEEDEDDEEYTVMQAPPSFEPHPGFSAGDYWDDKPRPPPV